MGEPSSLQPVRALLSSHDGLAFAELARQLASQGAEIWATSGTAKKLREHGIEARATDELTGISSWFGGRVKTLHPAIFGGILAPRDQKGTQELNERGIKAFDLVAVELYPFEAARQRQPPLSEAEMIELIDIGGVSLLRAAAKNYPAVIVISSPEDAAGVVQEMKRTGGTVALATRRGLASATFRRTVLYDTAIQGWMSESIVADRPFPLLSARCSGNETMRYGENPQQAAWVYLFNGGSKAEEPWPLEVLKGNTLSYNNYLDIDNSVSIVGRFSQPTAAVVKHATPCGVSSAADASEALARALDADPVARYGCVIAVNSPVDDLLVEKLRGTFVDLIVAPSFSPTAMEALQRRPKVKVVRFGGKMVDVYTPRRREARTAAGRLLVQECDQKPLVASTLKQVSRRSATPEELTGLEFAWEVVRFVRSNAIVLAKGSTTTGIGGGQTSRVGAVREAIEVAGARSQGSVMASDAFFPFPDGIEVAGKAGITAVLHSGGSIRDEEVVAAADKFGMAMYTTGWRVFRH